MNRAFLTLSLLCTLLTTAVAADQPLDKVLTNRYHDKVLALRQPFQSDDQQYDSDGKPLIVAPAGPWTIYRAVVVKKIAIDPDTLRLECRRVVYIFKISQLAPIQTNESVRITVRLKSPSPSEDEAGRLLNSIFMFSDEDIINSVPSYWRPYLTKAPAKAGVGGDEASQDRTKDCSTTLLATDHSECEAKVYRLGEAGVTAPKALFQYNPEFSEYARKLHVHGVVGVNITIDSAGQVTDMTIVKPMGAGLDEQAVNAISSWRFAPAMKNGQPVAVAVYIEMDFSWNY